MSVKTCTHFTFGGCNFVKFVTRLVCVALMNDLTRIEMMFEMHRPGRPRRGDPRTASPGLTIRMPPEMKAAVMAFARRHRMTHADAMRAMISKCLDEGKLKPLRKQHM